MPIWSICVGVLFRVWTYSDVGSRNVNEDCVRFSQDGESLSVAVCDGLGGHADGQRASHLAAHATLDSLQAVTFCRENLNRAVSMANRAIVEEGGSEGMRSTLALLWANGGRALVATVGDTRVYLFRGGGVEWQSTDHSLAQYDVALGEIAPDQVRGSARRNQLTRALGADEDVKPNVDELGMRSGDVFLLCTDGCWVPVEESEMLAFLAEGGPSQFAQRLERAVGERMRLAGDNHSAAVIAVGEGQGGEPWRTTA